MPEHSDPNFFYGGSSGGCAFRVFVTYLWSHSPFISQQDMSHIF
ncbi:hypothetical protein GW12_07070 [Acinetobacter sp. HR7]|nr:hypothetical protein GW12_07070 [Acinetobacter sp. HR7]